MATKMNDERGCSVCAAGSENFEFFTTRLGRKVYHRMQYDYRHTDGELFSCIGNDLESCRKRRDEWLSKKKGWTGKEQKGSRHGKTHIPNFTILPKTKPRATRRLRTFARRNCATTLLRLRIITEIVQAS